MRQDNNGIVMNITMKAAAFVVAFKGKAPDSWGEPCMWGLSEVGSPVTTMDADDVEFVM
jgi:hypothetical protein